MLHSILRTVRVAAVLTILVALSGHETVRPVVATDEGAKCQWADGFWCAGTNFNPDAECTGTVEPCTTCGISSGSCGGHGGYRKAE